MPFNPQEPPSVFSKEEIDIFEKCSDIYRSNNIEIGKEKLAYFNYGLIELLVSLDKWEKVFGEIDKYGEKEFYKYCKKYGISEEYEKYIIKKEFIYYVECYEIAIEHNIFGLKHPAEKIKELAREDYTTENPIFRGKPITINNKEIDNKQYTFISYDGKEYKFDEFLIAMYPGKRINKSVVYFPDTIANLLKIGPTQRIKMKYDILTYHFGLPYISDEEKNDLFRFLHKYYDNETIQKYYRRFNWDNGLEKMIAFGADLDISGKVDGAIEGFYCYEYKLNDSKALVTGIDTSLKEWLIDVKIYITSIFTIYKERKEVPCNKSIEKYKRESLMNLYYKQGKHIALPDIQLGRPIKEVIDYCIDTVCRKMKIDMSINISNIVDRCFNTLSIPDCQSDNYQFTVDFEKDVMIVDTRSAARAQQAIEQVYTTAAERLTGLKDGDKVTTQQLRERGYKNNNGKAINTLVEYGILKRGVLRGSYIMLKDF